MKGEFFPILGVLLLAGIDALVVGEERTRRALMLSAGVAASLWIISRLTPAVKQINTLAAENGMESAITALIKGIGITWAAAITSLALREIGAANAASFAELAGAAQLILLALPLVSELVSLAMALV